MTNSLVDILVASSRKRGSPLVGSSPSCLCTRGCTKWIKLFLEIRFPLESIFFFNFPSQLKFSEVTDLLELNQLISLLRNLWGFHTLKPGVLQLKKENKSGDLDLAVSSREMVAKASGIEKIQGECLE